MIDTPLKALYPSEWTPATDYKPGDIIPFLKASGYGNGLGFDVLRRDLVTRYIYVEESQTIDVSTTTGDLVIRVHVTGIASDPAVEIVVDGYLQEGRIMAVSMDRTSARSVLLTVGGTVYQLSGDVKSAEADIYFLGSEGIIRFVSLGASWSESSMFAEILSGNYAYVNQLINLEQALFTGSALTVDTGVAFTVKSDLAMANNAIMKPSLGVNGSYTVSPGFPVTLPAGFYMGSWTGSEGGGTTRQVQIYNGVSWVPLYASAGANVACSFYANSVRTRLVATGSSFTFQFIRS